MTSSDYFVTLADRLPADRLPADRLSADRLPADRLPDDRLPDDQLSADQLPDDQLSADRPQDLRLTTRWLPADQLPFRTTLQEWVEDARLMLLVNEHGRGRAFMCSAWNQFWHGALAIRRAVNMYLGNQNVVVLSERARELVLELNGHNVVTDKYLAESKNAPLLSEILKATWIFTIYDPQEFKDEVQFSFSFSSSSKK